MINPEPVALTAKPAKFLGGGMSTPPRVNQADILKRLKAISTDECLASLVKVMKASIKVPNDDD